MFKYFRIYADSLQCRGMKNAEKLKIEFNLALAAALSSDKKAEEVLQAHRVIMEGMGLSYRQINSGKRWEEFKAINPEKATMAVASTATLAPVFKANLEAWERVTLIRAKMDKMS